MDDIVEDPVLFDRLVAQHTKELTRLGTELEQRSPQLQRDDPRQGLELCRLLKAEVDYGRYLMQLRPPNWGRSA